MSLTKTERKLFELSFQDSARIAFEFLHSFQSYMPLATVSATSDHSKSNNTGDVLPPTQTPSGGGGLDFVVT